MPQYSNDIAITFPGGTPLVGCAAGVQAISNAIDNTTNQFGLVDVQVTFRLGTGVNTSTGVVKIGILASDDGGTTYENYLLLSNTFETVTNLIGDGRIFIIRFQVTNVPQFWKLALANFSGTAFSTNAPNFASVYAGVYDTVSPTLTATQTNVTSVATLIATAVQNRQNVLVTNTGGITIYLGPSDVTTLTGFPVLPSTDVLLPELSNNNLYGISPSTTVVAAVMTW